MALALGRTVDDLTEHLPYEEFLEWQEYYSIEPFGEWRGDVRAGVIASVVANVNRDPTRKPEPYTAEDFMMFKQQRAQRVTEESDDGAHISPATIAWLFGQVNQSVQ